MRYLFFSLMLLCSYAAHAVDCSKGAPPPKELTLQITLFSAQSPRPPQEVNAHFEGHPEVRWSDDGRCMTLLNEVTYVDKRGDRWTAWKGMGTDGATIPPVAWSFIGGPYEGPYRKAALVHDAACYLQSRSWQASARMFYEAMLIAGTSRTKALLMFEAVYMFGPKWTVVRDVPFVPVGSEAMAANQILVNEGLSRGPDVKVTSSATGSLASGKRLVTVTITPPNPVKFTANDFETLAKQIQTREEANPGTVTLEEIESYKPAQPVPSE